MIEPTKCSLPRAADQARCELLRGVAPRHRSVRWWPWLADWQLNAVGKEEMFINTGTTTMRYLALPTLVDVEACEYPDWRKILIVPGQRGERNLRKMFRAEATVDYYDREKTEGHHS